MDDFNLFLQNANGAYDRDGFNNHDPSKIRAAYKVLRGIQVQESNSGIINNHYTDHFEAVLRGKYCEIYHCK